ncbi:MAG: hypothetical protein OXT74_03690, partial [Candidatus Poribacteria bacterium]|nr:hypothetical protein [Candidatus Poribacteria bacterium]
DGLGRQDSLWRRRRSGAYRSRDFRPADACVRYACKKTGNNIALLVESVVIIPPFSFNTAFGDFIFLRAQKNEAKKGRPCGGLAQRKLLKWMYAKSWPSKLDADKKDSG